MKGVTEGDVLKGCLQYLHLMGVHCWRQNQGAIPLDGGRGYRKFSGMRGLSDILGVLPVHADGETFGVLLAVEVKKPGGRVRPEQAAFLARLNALGGVGLLVSSAGELAEKIAPHLSRRAEGGGG